MSSKIFQLLLSRSIIEGLFSARKSKAPPTHYKAEILLLWRAKFRLKLNKVNPPRCRDVLDKLHYIALGTDFQKKFLGINGHRLPTNLQIPF